MFWLDIDLKTDKNTVHRDSCVHSVPENNPSKGTNEMGEKGGWFSFPTVGEAVLYTKVNKISGLVEYCVHCTPLKSMKPESRAALGLKAIATGCAACGKCAMGNESNSESFEVTDTKTIASRLSRKLFGDR
jgi:hypothetical protein